jgi:hypothetical protein
MASDIAQCPTQYGYNKSTIVSKLHRMHRAEFLIHYCHHCYYIPSFTISIVLKLTKEENWVGYNEW